MKCHFIFSVAGFLFIPLLCSLYSMRGDQNNLGVEFFIMTLYTQNVLNSRTATENVEKNENQTKYTEFVKIESKCKILECTRER